MKNILISLKLTLSFCVILFGGYVMILWGVAAITQPNNGQAQTLTLDNRVVGAVNIGQQFTLPQYFRARPSAVNYDGAGSGASNKGVANPQYLADLSARIDEFLTAHPYLTRSEMPAEMVTAGASGLDPHISPASAAVQARRVAKARGVTTDQIKDLIERNTQKPLVGPQIINVLLLNIELDKKYGQQKGASKQFLNYL